MKKLIFAAAGAVMIGSVTAGLCDPEAVAESCSLYDVKFTFKTLAAKKACADGAKWLVTDNTGIGVWYRSTLADAQAKLNAGSGTVAAADYLDALMENGSYVAVASQRPVYWMDNATRKFQGYLWQCAAHCFEGAPADVAANNNGRINLALWEKKSNLAISYPIFALRFVNVGADGSIAGTASIQYASLDEQQNFRFLGRYGKKAQKVAAYWRPSLRNGQTIDAAGFGSYDSKNLRIKSVSGNAVGMISPLNEGEVDACGNVGNFFCAIGFLCVEWKDWCCDGCYAGVELVPASGTWSIKYNATATKKANADKKKLTDWVPAYMFYATASEWANARAIDPYLYTDGYYWVNVADGSLLYKDGSVSVVDTLDAWVNNVALKQHTIIDIANDGILWNDGTDNGFIVGGATLTVEGEEVTRQYLFYPINDGTVEGKAAGTLKTDDETGALECRLITIERAE